MKKGDLSTFIAGVAILAVVYMLVRPGMPSVVAIQETSKILTAMVRSATGWENPSNSGPAQQSI